MRCGRCDVASCHRVPRSHDLRLCLPCYRAALEAALGGELEAWTEALDGVADAASHLRWNRGRRPTEVPVALEDGRVRLDLHGLDGPLAAEAARMVAARIVGARLPAVRLVVGAGGDDVLRTSAIRALAEHLDGPVTIRPGRGHLDVDAGAARLVDVVAAERPTWRDPPRSAHRAARPAGPSPGWRALVRVVGRLRGRLAARSERR